MLEKFLKGLAAPAGQDALYLLGASLKDISGGGSDNFAAAQNVLAGRRKEADELAAFDALASRLFGNGPAGVAGGQGEDVLAGGAQPAGWSVMDGPQNLRGPDLQGNPGERGGMTPEMQARIGALRKGRNIDALLRLYEADQPSYERGEDGWYEMRRGVAPKLVSKFAEKPQRDPIPMGMEVGEDGKLRWRPGYLEAQLALTGGRRQEVVDRPMPSRARTGGGRSGGGAPGGLPSGFTLD